MGLLLFCCSLLPAPDRSPLAPRLLSAGGASRVVGLAKGAVLVGLVRPGMSKEQVHRILGEPTSWAVSGGGLFESYHAYGVQVFWRSPFDSRHRGKPPAVQEARYVWACWAEWGQR